MTDKEHPPIGQLSESLEDYVEIIYNLIEEHKVARVRDIAKAKDVKMSSVVSALKRLDQEKLVKYEAHEFVELTETGRDLASRLLRRHNFLTRFLVDVLRIDPQTAEQDACQMEHAISPETTCNVYINALGYAFGTFPWDPDALTDQGGIVYEETFIDNYSHALSHEMGHCLGLWHTHHGVSEVEECGHCYEKPEPPSDTTGDFCADTPPTPINYACEPPGGTDPCSGIPWGPTQPENYMSYGGLSPPCWELFTPSQAARMHCWIEATLPTWLTCPVPVDCNENLIPDGCDLNECDGSPWCDDCNDNGVLDVCDIEGGSSEDGNENGIPDECDCWGDLDEDGEINLSDLAQLLAHYGMASGATYYDGDLDGDGDVDLADLAELLAHYGESC